MVINMVKLRPYQNNIIEKYFNNEAKNKLILLPTGGGKTIVLSEITRRFLSNGKSVLILCHRNEIYNQIMASLALFNIYPTLKKQEPSNCHLAIINGFFNYIINKQFDLIIVDECHHVVANAWHSVIQQQANADILGLTATPYRLDNVGLGNLFDDMIDEVSIKYLIANNYLCNYDIYAPDEERIIDDDGQINGNPVQHYFKLELQSKVMLAFCASLAEARHMQGLFNDNNISTVLLHGKLNTSVRNQIVDDIRARKYQIIFTVNLVDEGFDVPEIDGVIFLCKTQSTALYLQRIGRCLRYKEGKRAIILDHCSNVHMHGLPCEERKWTLDGKVIREKTIAGRTCLECYAYFLTSKCPNGCEIDINIPIYREGEISIKFNNIELKKIEINKIKTENYIQEIQAVKNNGFQGLVELANKRGIGNPVNWAKCLYKYRTSYIKV